MLLIININRHNLLKILLFHRYFFHSNDKYYYDVFLPKQEKEQKEQKIAESLVEIVEKMKKDRKKEEKNAKKG